MRGIEGEQVLLRIIVSEDQTHGWNRYISRSSSFCGAKDWPAPRCSRGWPVSATIAPSTPRLSRSPPGPTRGPRSRGYQEHIDRLLPKLDALMVGGVIMMERAQVNRYTQAPPASPTT